MTRDQECVIRPAAALGYLIFAGAITVNPFLWPLGALVVLAKLGEKK